MVDLCDYWVHAPGSVTSNQERNFWFAVRRATWMGMAFLGQELCLRGSQSSLDDLMDMDQEPHTLQGPEEVIIEEEMRETVLDLVDGLDDQRAGWLKGHLGGMTCREEALHSGVPFQTVHWRRTKVLTELQCQALEAGVL
jgi:DNA-directed RNA polymerase specialized sigma24 family protein